MTTLANRPNTALLVIDVQTGVVERAFHREAVVANIAATVDKARQANVPVIWIQHENDKLVKGEDRWRIVPELAPADTELHLAKRYGDAFEDTELERMLADRGVGKLVVTGAQTDACVRATLHGA